MLGHNFNENVLVQHWSRDTTFLVCILRSLVGHLECPSFTHPLARRLTRPTACSVGMATCFSWVPCIRAPSNLRLCVGSDAVLTLWDLSPVLRLSQLALHKDLVPQHTEHGSCLASWMYTKRLSSSLLCLLSSLAYPCRGGTSHNAPLASWRAPTYRER